MHSQLISVYPFYSVTSFLRFFALRRLNLPEEFGVEKHLILVLPEDHRGFRNMCIFLVVPTANENSQARDQNCATVATQTMAVTMPNPSPLGHQATPLQFQN